MFEARERNTAGKRTSCRVFFLLFCLPVALRAFGAEDPKVQERRTIHLLIRDLAAKKPAVRAAAERKLKQFGEKAAPDLILALDNRHIAVTTMPAERNEIARGRAARVLGAIGGKRAGKHLTGALADPSILVRRSVINALGEMRCKDAVPELLKLASDDSATIASDAVLALGAIRDKAAVKDVLKILNARQELKAKYKNDADVSRVRGAAAFALGMLGDTAAVDALLAVLRDPDAHVRRHANWSLILMSGRDLGFKADAPEAEREKAAKAWDAWWKAKRKK